MLKRVLSTLISPSLNKKNMSLKSKKKRNPTKKELSTKKRKRKDTDKININSIGTKKKSLCKPLSLKHPKRYCPSLISPNSKQNFRPRKNYLKSSTKQSNLSSMKWKQFWKVPARTERKVSPWILSFQEYWRKKTTSKWWYRMT